MQSFFSRCALVVLAHACVGAALIPLTALAKDRASTEPSATVARSGDIPESVKLSAWIQPGKRAEDKLTLNVNLTAPNAKRVCIAYTGFETIGFVRKASARSYENLDVREHKCSDQAGQAGGPPFSDSVVMQRRDPPNSSVLLRPNFEGLEQAEQRRRDEFRDGYVIVVVTLDGEPAVFKIKSPYFSMDSVVVKKLELREILRL